MRRATDRVRAALMDERLAVSPCILIAQQRMSLAFDDSLRAMHLKLLGQLIDQCQVLDCSLFILNTSDSNNNKCRRPSINLARSYARAFRCRRSISRCRPRANSSCGTTCLSNLQCSLLAAAIAHSSRFVDQTKYIVQFLKENWAFSDAFRRTSTRNSRRRRRQRQEW